MSKHKHYELRTLSSDLTRSDQMVASNRSQTRFSRWVIVLVVITAVVSLACLAAGLVIIVRYHNRPCIQSGASRKDGQNTECETNCSTADPTTATVETATPTRVPTESDPCDFSSEARRTGLPELFNKIRDAASRAGQEVYRPVTFSPQFLKEVTDQSKDLLVELNRMHFNKNLLTQRENRMLAQIKHFLRHNFGNPYYQNYYTGAWMLGPNAGARGRTCNAEAVSHIPRYIWMVARYHKPVTLEDMQEVLKLLQEIGKSVIQYETNVRMGVKVGMVRTLEECRVGIQCLYTVLAVKTFTNATDILSTSTFAFKRFLSRVSPEALDQWQQRYGKNMSRSLDDALVDYIGTPLVSLFKYLEDHLVYCPPSNISRGMGTRPLDFIYYNGTKTGNQTSKRLPTGEPINGTASYNQLLAHVNTLDYLNAEYIHNLGWQILNENYQQAQDIAKKWMKTENVTEAVHAFKLYLNDSAMYFNNKPFPKNESYEQARAICSNYDNAKNNCPVRYATMIKWLDYARSTMTTLQARMVRAFHTQPGPKKTTPTCPVSPRISFSTTFIVPTYRYLTRPCRVPAMYELPFYADRMGPKLWSETAHEVFPGHHLQLKGFFDNFWVKCRNDLMSRNEYFVFKEGWATYAEDPVLRRDVQGAYDFPKLDLVQEYGVVRSLIWRALRLVIDTGLHSKGMSNDKINQLYRKYLWLVPSDVIENEINRSLRNPGSLTAYMIGRQFLIQLRNDTETALGQKQFNLKDFHYHVLSEGPLSTLPDVRNRVNKYVRCTKTPSEEGCRNFLI